MKEILNKEHKEKLYINYMWEINNFIEAQYVKCEICFVFDNLKMWAHMWATCDVKWIY
jgi:hypothetical protein